MAAFARSVCVAAAVAAALVNFAQGLECLCGSYLETASGISADGDSADAAKTAFESCPANATKFHIGNGRYVGTCKTDGYCFKSVHRQDADIKTSYRYVSGSLLETQCSHLSVLLHLDASVKTCWNRKSGLSSAIPPKPGSTSSSWHAVGTVTSATSTSP